jgi:hypothetical protein
MPTLDDLPIIPTLSAVAAGDFIPVSDSSASGSGPSKVRKLPVSSIVGLAADDVTLDADGGTITATRLTLISGGTTSTVNIPAPSGDLREVIVLNSGSGDATVTAAAATIKTAVTPTASTTYVVATDVTARFLSDGTFWYLVSAA